MPARCDRELAGDVRAADERSHSSAFTLVEILVVVVIIGVLAAILVPSLTRARAIARDVLCGSQLRRWGQAFAVYAVQNRNYYPHIDGLDRDHGPADRFGWVDVIPPLMGKKPWRDHPIWHRPGAGTFFQCPAARLADDGEYDYQPRRCGYFSYAMNSCLELDDDCWRAPDSNERLPSFLNVKLIGQPERVVLLFDQLLDPSKGYDGRRRYGSAGKYCGSYPKAFSARHAKERGKLGGSILYCDYHVEWKASVWKARWPMDTEVPPRSDENWFPYPPGG